MIETRALIKNFGRQPVLRGVNLRVEAGEFVALMGPNGAGKTTLLRIICSLARPTLGAVSVAGLALPAEAEAVRRRLGVIAHHPLLYTDLTAEENLTFYARLYGLADPGPRLLALLERVGLAARRRDLVRTFSRGMQQRLAIARGLLHEPDVLLLDEPYTGLDPIGAQVLDGVVREHAARGGTLLMITHDLEHGFALADRSVILVRGQIVFSARRDELAPAEFAQRYGALVQ